MHVRSENPAQCIVQQMRGRMVAHDGEAAFQINFGCHDFIFYVRKIIFCYVQEDVLIPFCINHFILDSICNNKTSVTYLTTTFPIKRSFTKGEPASNISNNDRIEF